MPWVTDGTKFFDFAFQTEVPSAVLDEIQDREIELYNKVGKELAKGPSPWDLLPVVVDAGTTPTVTAATISWGLGESSTVRVALPGLTGGMVVTRIEGSADFASDNGSLTITILSDTAGTSARSLAVARTGAPGSAVTVPFDDSGAGLTELPDGAQCSLELDVSGEGQLTITALKIWAKLVDAAPDPT